MNVTFVQKQSPAQKKDVLSAASILDTSSQSKSLQRKADMVNNATQRAETPRPNNTGMPDNLKSGIESLSGFSMDDVRVHYNSSKPATVQALAYTQGTDIHVAPGQEKLLPHEAWHVTQQMTGRVSPTTNINGMPVNDNAALEHEADVMGLMAVQCRGCNNTIISFRNEQKNRVVQMSVTSGEMLKMEKSLRQPEQSSFIVNVKVDRSTSQKKFMEYGNFYEYIRTLALNNPTAMISFNDSSFFKGVSYIICQLPDPSSNERMKECSIAGLPDIRAVREAVNAASTPPSTEDGCTTEFESYKNSNKNASNASLHNIDYDRTDAKDASNLVRVERSSNRRIPGTNIQILGLKHLSHGSGSGAAVPFTTAFFTRDHLYALANHSDWRGEIRYIIVWKNPNIPNDFVLDGYYVFAKGKAAKG